MTDDRPTSSETADIRDRVLDVASALIERGGVAALTTRAVAAAAGIQAPTLYRVFGDKTGLLHAVAEHRLAAFVAGKANEPSHPDPVNALREGWDGYVAFGLANPAVFAIMNEIGAPAAASPATQAGITVLRKRVEQIARAGRLTVSVERAVGLTHAAGLGTVATLLATPEHQRDPSLSRLAREAVLASITSDRPANSTAGVTSLALGLRAHLREVETLSPGERLILDELLARIADQPC